MFIGAEDRIDDYLSLRSDAEIFLRQELHELVFRGVFVGHWHEQSINQRENKSTERYSPDGRLWLSGRAGIVPQEEAQSIAGFIVRPH